MLYSRSARKNWRNLTWNTHELLVCVANSTSVFHSEVQDWCRRLGNVIERIRIYTCEISISRTDIEVAKRDYGDTFKSWKRRYSFRYVYWSAYVEIYKTPLTNSFWNKNCPQQPAIFSSPRPKHLHFTSNRKSTNLTTPVARSFLPAVAQQSSFPAL